MSRTFRLALVAAALCAASACGSRAEGPVLPADAAGPNTNLGPASTDSTSVMMLGPGTMGSGN